ncbi:MULTISPECIES: ricin-type beta-trefoil lectin domain protein [unclassified Kitasatospora]|uniref:ricin-type beta-trefoil lectin domain protein n=1 Tax=unclassified Kitasatospora TaxID=2633591 RepID=UPI00247557BB|nr:ricin-type beta-trefoil lectin domain protein [Kitasatospora sp. GAS204B]
MSRLVAVTALATAAALTASGVQALADTPTPAPTAGYDPGAAAQYRKDQCVASYVLRRGGPAVKTLVAGAMDGTPAQLHAALDDDTRSHSTPFHDAYLADQAAYGQAVQAEQASKDSWHKQVDGLTNPGMTQPAFYEPPDLFSQLWASSSSSKVLGLSESDLAGQPAALPVDPAARQAAEDLGKGRYGTFPDVGKDPNYLQDAQESTAWTQLHPGFSLSADDLRIFLAAGGFPRGAAQPGTGEYRVAVEDLKARFANCDFGNPDAVDPNKVLGQQVQTAAGEWQAEVAGQQAQRDAIVAQNTKAVAALKASADALGNALGQSWAADRLSAWQAYFSSGQGAVGTGPITFHLHPAPGACLEVPRWDPTNGNDVDAWGCNSGLNQVWHLTAQGALVNNGTNKCLDIPWSSTGTHAGSRVEIWDCNGGSNQQWQLTTTNGLTRFYNPASNLCLDLHTANWGQTSQVSDCNGSPQQQFDAQQDNRGTGTGSDSPSFPKQAEFDRVKNALPAAQQAAKAQLQVAQQQAAIAQSAADETVKAQQQAWAVADAAGEPRGRGLLAGQQEAQATLASAAATAAVAKATETAYDATMASGADAQALQQLARTQAAAAQAQFRGTAAQAAADQAQAAADGAALQAQKAAQAAKDAQADLTTAQGAEQSAKQAADTAHTKRQAAEGAQATAADAKNKAAAAQAKTATDRSAAQSAAATAVAKSQAAQAAGVTADQKKTAAQQADQAARQAQQKAWDAEQKHNADQAKADAADAYAASQASGADAQGAKDAAAAADRDAGDSQSAAGQATTDAGAASAAAQTAEAESTRAQAAATQAQSDASDANAAKATADAAVRTDQSAAADAMSASDRASSDATAAQSDANTAKTQADTAQQNAIQAWAQAGTAQSTSAAAAGYAYATAQAASAAASAAKQVAQPANDAVQLGAPYQDTDASAGLAVLLGQDAKSIADQQQALAQAKSQQAQQAADQAASLANAATGDAQAADLASAKAAASAAKAQASAKDALASSAQAAAAAALAQASQARAVQYDTAATADAAAAQAAATGAAGDATDAHTSAVAATDDAGKAWAAAGSAQAAATTAKEVADQATKDAAAAAAAAKDAQQQATTAQQNAVNAEALAQADQEAAAQTAAAQAAQAQQAAVSNGGPTSTPKVFTKSSVTQNGDPTPDNTCVLGLGNTGCDVTFTQHFTVTIDFYLCDTVAPGDVGPDGCPPYATTWLDTKTIDATRQVVHHFSNWDIVSSVDKAVLKGMWDSTVKDFTDCSHGSVTGCVWAASWFIPPAKVADAAKAVGILQDAMRSGVGIADALKAVKASSLDAEAIARLEQEADAVQKSLTVFDRDAEAAKLPAYAGGATSGRAIAANGKAYDLVSGNQDAALIDWVNSTLRQLGILKGVAKSGRAADVEQKFAAIMARDGIARADLVINFPTGPCTVRLGCDDVMDALLGSTRTLTVHWRDADGAWHDLTYGGH